MWEMVSWTAGWQVNSGKDRYVKAGKDLPGEHVHIMAPSASRPMSLDSNAPGTPTHELE